ncbi:MAG: penicillin-binding protein 1A [Desulfosudaceae bacterium]
MRKTRKQGRNRAGLVLVLMAGACCGTIAGLFLAIVHDLPQIRQLEDFTPSSVTRIYSADQVLLSELFVEKREPVDAADIPPVLADALVATEDNRFYAHSGIDLKGILRAAVMDLLAGEFVQGGSTITQQLAKTLFLTHQKTLLRKLKEAILAVQLERRYTKKEILTLYLNQVYFGSGTYGIKSAAALFFGKDPSRLTIAECALVAGLPKSPSRFSPLVNPELAIQRRNIVLRQMREHQVITDQEYKTARKEPLRLAEGIRNVARAPYFISYIKPFLENTVGAEKLYKGGLTVHTTLSASLQSMAETALAGGVAALEKRMAERGLPDKPQAALVAVDVRTGGISAMVGGRDFGDSPYNRATRARRQPGSSFKPILYACALGHGFTQATTVLNTPVVFEGAGRQDTWEPDNFSQTYSSEMTLREALARSKNIPAVRVMNKLGPASVADFAARLGIASPLSPYLSLALGTSEVTLLELTGAYAVFPRRGQRIKPYGVSRILDRDGRVIWQARPIVRQVMPADDAAIITDMLQAVIAEGTGRSARDILCPLAGKTGTTDHYRDALFVGYSRKIAAGVWTGTDNYSTLGKPETGARAALPIWKDFMEKAVTATGCLPFDRPGNVIPVKIDPSTGKQVPARVDGGVYALFKKGSEPDGAGKRW